MDAEVLMFGRNNGERGPESRARGPVGLSTALVAQGRREGADPVSALNTNNRILKSVLSLRLSRWS